MAEAEQFEEEELAQGLGIPDLVGIDVYIIDMYLRCLGGPYKEGAIRSQRDLFGVCLGRPAGMPEIMAGQIRSVSVSRRREQTSPRDEEGLVVVGAARLDHVDARLQCKQGTVLNRSNVSALILNICDPSTYVMCQIISIT